jgi:hypothetical protein
MSTTAYLFWIDERFDGNIIHICSLHKHSNLECSEHARYRKVTNQYTSYCLLIEIEDFWSLDEDDTKLV